MFLGLDIGTSGVKAVVLTRGGRVAAQATAPVNTTRPHPLWSEQNPDDWVSACDTAVMTLSPGLRRRVEAIGLAGQMHGATLLGADDHPLRPAILWNDGRSFAQCAALEAGAPGSHQITGNLAMPGFTAPKLLWVRDHEPAIFDATHSVLLPKDYVRLALTGDKASDMSDAAGTLWLNVGARAWSPTMLAATGLDQAQMPLLYEGSDVTGKLRQDVAQRWGMTRVPVAAGAGDNAAGALGVGVTQAGQGMISLGTSGVIFVATSQFRPNPARAVHAFCHALPCLWHQMTVHLSAASCIDWAAALCRVNGPGEFHALAQTAEPGPELFLPYLSGERTPHNDPHVRGAFFGMGHETGTAELAAAVLEGVAFAHAQGLAALREAGTQIDALTVIGGGSRSLHWGRILASVLDVRLDYCEGGDVGPGLGAAHLAQIAVTGRSPAEVCRRPAIHTSIEPDPLLAERLAPKAERYARAYAALKTIDERI